MPGSIRTRLTPTVTEFGPLSRRPRGGDVTPLASRCLRARPSCVITRRSCHARAPPEASRRPRRPPHLLRVGPCLRLGKRAAAARPAAAPRAPRPAPAPRSGASRLSTCLASSTPSTVAAEVKRRVQFRAERVTSRALACRRSLSQLATRRPGRGAGPEQLGVQLPYQLRPVAVAHRLDERAPHCVDGRCGRPRHASASAASSSWSAARAGPSSSSRTAARSGHVGPSSAVERAAQLLVAERLVLEQRQLPPVERIRERGVRVG